MKTIPRGEFGYLHQRKKRIWISVVILFLIGVAFFVTGLLLNHMSRKNMFSLLAALSVLPWAKQMVALVVLFPRKSVSKERYDKIMDVLPEGTKLLSNMYISSPEKIMELDFIVMGQKQVIGLIGSKEKDVKTVKEYLTKGIRNWGDEYRVKIVEKETQFLDEIEHMQQREVDEEEEEKVESFLRSLVV